MIRTFRQWLGSWCKVGLALPLGQRQWLGSWCKAGLALSLGQLGNCLRPPSERGAQNFRKEGVVGAKKKKSFR